MAKRTTRKDLLKSEDEFLTFSSRALTFFTTHMRELKIAAIAAAAIAVIFLGGTAFYRHINEKGQEAYNRAYSAMAEQVGPQMDSEKLSEVRSLFADVVENHGMSKAADLALPQLAFLDFLEKNYNEAIYLYQEFKANYDEDSMFITLSVLGLAACHEAKGDLDKAIALLDPIAGESSNKFRETALFTLIRLYRQAGENSRASELATDFIKDFQGSAFEPIVKTYL